MRIFRITSDRNKNRDLRFSPLERGDKDASKHILQTFSTIFLEYLQSRSFKIDIPCPVATMNFRFSGVHQNR